MNLLNLFTPDTLNIIFAVGGAAFGWWLKRHPDNKIPPELADVVQLLLARRAAIRQAQAHAALQELVQSPSVSPPSR